MQRSVTVAETLNVRTPNRLQPAPALACRARSHLNRQPSGMPEADPTQRQEVHAPAAPILKPRFSSKNRDSGPPGGTGHPFVQPRPVSSGLSGRNRRQATLAADEAQGTHNQGAGAVRALDSGRSPDTPHDLVSTRRHRVKVADMDGWSRRGSLGFTDDVPVGSGSGNAPRRRGLRTSERQPARARPTTISVGAVVRC